MSALDVSPDRGPAAFCTIPSVVPLALTGKVRPLTENRMSGIAKSCIPAVDLYADWSSR
jgi:hypothetical protein